MKSCVMVLLLAVTASARAQTSDVDQVRALDAGWARSYQVHDTAYAKSLFADSIIVTATNGSVKNKEGELRDVRPQSGLVMSYFRTRDMVIRVYGDAAVVSGVAEWSFTYNGQPNNQSRRYTATYVRGGPLGWQIVALHIGRSS
jgi:ketosteroid isomerase-like protein